MVTLDLFHQLVNKVESFKIWEHQQHLHPQILKIVRKQEVGQNQIEITEKTSEQQGETKTLRSSKLKVTIINLFPFLVGKSENLTKTR